MVLACLLVGLVVGQVVQLPPCCRGNDPIPPCAEGTPEVDCTLIAPPVPTIPPDPKHTTRNDYDLPRGTFFNIGNDYTGSVVELALDETVRRVGPPANQGLSASLSAFDSRRKLIYGIGSTRDISQSTAGGFTFIEVDPETGNSRILQTLDRFPPANLSDMTYHPDLDMIFYLSRIPEKNQIIQWNPQTGQQMVVVGLGGEFSYYWQGLTYVSDFLGKYTGLLTTDDDGFVFVFEGPRFEAQRTGLRLASGSHLGRLLFDHTTHTLFSTDKELGQVDRFDERSQTFTPILWPRFAVEKSPGGFCFVPDGALDE